MTTRRQFLRHSSVTALFLSASLGFSEESNNSLGMTHQAHMTVRKIQRTDLVVSRLAFGCAMLGWSWEDPDFVNKTVPIIRTAYDRGMNFFDLADVYGNGGAEEALGRVLRETVGLRHRLVIQSKCGVVPQEPSAIDESGKHIIASVEGSLRRLGTDYLDILLLHWPDDLVQPEEVARAFDALRHSGKVRYFGVSNHSAVQYELLQKVISQRLIANQIQLGLLHRDFIPRGFNLSWVHAEEGAETLNYCRLHDIWVQAYSPLSADDVDHPPNVFNPPSDAPPEVQELAQLLESLARKYDANRAAIMLAWLL